MALLDFITDLFGGADEHIQNATDAAQNLQDQAGELGANVEELTGGLGEQAQGVVDGVKDKLGQ